MVQSRASIVSDDFDAKSRGALSLFRATLCQRRDIHFSSRVISFVPYWRHTFCQAGLYYEVYYRHLAHLSDRLGSLEVAISLIPKINYRPDYFGHSFDPQPLLLKYRRRSRVNRFQLVILPHFLGEYHR